MLVAALVAAVPVVAPASPALATAPASIGLTSATLDTGGEAWGVAIADVTGDARADLIVTNHGSSDASLEYKVLVYAQQPDGSLASSPEVYSPSATPTGSDSWMFPAVGDVNGDGALDLIIGHESGLDVFAQSGGLLSGPVNYATSGSVHDIQIGDLNGDGLQDVVYSVLMVSGDYKYSRRFQQLDGTLGGAVQIATGQAESFALGDLNGDAKPDLVLEDPVAGLIPILLHNSVDNDFTAADDARASGVVSAQIADVNGDARNDLVFLDGSGLQVMAGNLEGSLADPVATSLAGGEVAIEVADMNGDATNDVVAFGAAGTEVLLQDALGALVGGCPFETVIPTPFGGKETVAVGDLTGDGRPDAAGGQQGVPLRLLLQQAPGDKSASVVSAEVLPSSVEIGSTVTVSGELTLGSGGCLGFDTMAIWRELPGGVPEKIGTASLVQQDVLTYSYSFDDVAPVVGTVTYHAAWAGDDWHAFDASPDTVTDVTAHVSALSLQATPGTIAPTEQTTLTATLTGGEAGPGREVSFYDMSGGTKTFLATVPVDVSDEATLTVSPATTRTYRAEFAGDATWTSAFATAKVTVKKKASALSLSVSDPSIVYGGTTNLVATLDGGDGAREVSFYRLTDTGKKLLGTAAVNRKDKAVFTVKPTAHTSYVARYLGSAVWAASTSNTRDVTVKVVIAGKMTRYRSKDGVTAVYDCCRAYYWFTVKPKHPYAKVTVTIDYYANGSWHNLGSKVFQLRKDGTDEIFIDVAGGKGLRLRVRSQFKSDADHLGAISAYSFFRFV